MGFGFFINSYKAEATSEFDSTNVILESSFGSMVEYLAFLLIGRKLGDIFGLSRLAEVGARYVHLEGSGQRLEEMTKKLKLKYFRLRHEVIDQSMRELFSARMAGSG